MAIVIFRGSWCKYDKHYLQKLGKFHKGQMRQDGLKLIAWTSEGSEGAKEADLAWGLTEKFGFEEVIGDQTNALAKYLVDECLLENLVITTTKEANAENLVSEGTYQNGLVQPGMLWYAHHGNLVLRWTSEAHAPSFGGAYRPNPPGTLTTLCIQLFLDIVVVLLLSNCNSLPWIADVWEAVKKRKHELDKGDAVMPINGNNLRQCSSPFEVNCILS